MSKQCRVVEIALTILKPAFVEFTATKGVLRALKPNESRARAEGLIFACPRCSHDKEKAHFCIFLFDLEKVPAIARPWGRFAPAVTMEKVLESGEERDVVVPESFDKISLHMVLPNKEHHPWLIPGDLKCKWQGTLQNGFVRWSPNLFERWRGL